MNNEKIKKWTKWTPMKQGNEVVAFYRTNQKKVEVRLPLSNIRAVATCNGDEFDLHFGIQLAYARCEQKLLKNKQKELALEADDYIASIHEICTVNDGIDSRLREIKNNISQMLKTLD